MVEEIRVWTLPSITACGTRASAVCKALRDSRRRGNRIGLRTRACNAGREGNLHRRTQQVTFTGTYCYTPLEFGETLNAIARGWLGALDWFEERPLADGQQAFRDMDAGSLAAAKIILRP